MKSAKWIRIAAFMAAALTLICATGCASVAKKTAKAAVTAPVKATKATVTTAGKGVKAVGGAVLGHDDEDKDKLRRDKD